MKKLFFVLFVVLTGLVSFCVYAADSSDEAVVNSRLIWSVSGIYNDSAGKPLCVNESAVVKVLNHNTRKPLGSAFVRIFEGLNLTHALYTDYTGNAYFMPNKTGTFKIFIQRQKYMDARGTFDVIDCSEPTTTSTTTTSTTSTTTTSSTTTTFEDSETTETTLAATTTTEYVEPVPGNASATTFPVCSSCQANKNNQNILVALAVAMALVILTWSLLGSKKKKEKKSKEGSKVEEAVSGEHTHSHKKHKKKHSEAKGESIE